MDCKFSNILVVDDDRINRRILSRKLAHQGHNVITAENGRQALDIAFTQNFDLILLDIMMPELDGFETCEQLKENPRTKDVPIIFITSMSEEESIVKGFEIGAVDYVTKPFREAELLERVNTHLELKHSREELKELNAAKDKFFSIIAHDLKNPLSALILISDLLKQSFRDLPEEKLAHFLENVNISAHHLYKLLENLLDWSRIQTERINFEPRRISLKLLAKGTVELLRPTAENKGIILREEVPEKIFIFADENMIMGVIRNLLTNAIKFTDAGGKVTLKAEEEEDVVKIAVMDTGVGISQVDIEKLFRIDVTHTTIGTSKEKGTGLGLILCKEFVEKNGGKIWVVSELGKGSAFKFTLPKG